MTGLPLLGDRLPVPLVGGGTVPALNLDFAASAPALVAVRDAVEAFLPWYSSVHRGAGYASRVATQAYEAARVEVCRFVGAPDPVTVVFTRNTTDAVNLLATALPAGARVVTFAGEHHANLLPWRRRSHVHLPLPAGPEQALADLDEALRGGRNAAPALVAVSGASNVTGELWPLARIAEVAHRHGAKLFVDAAQLAPHAPVDMAGCGIDYLALSGHKLYAPYGAGALLGDAEWLGTAEPMLAGGGAVQYVTVDDVAWAGLPDRQEAGSPNVVGAVALAAACRALRGYGMDRIAAEEADLAAFAGEALSRVPGLTRYLTWPGGHPRIGVLTFNLAGRHHALVAAALSAEYGIAVRDGCFCAHPLMLRLLGVGAADAEQLRHELAGGRHRRIPGAVRVSFGLTTTRADISRAVAAVEQLAAAGPRGSYHYDEDTGRYLAAHEDRPWPAGLTELLVPAGSPAGAGVGAAHDGSGCRG